MAQKKLRVSYRKRQILGGLLFTFPFIIGFALFFLYPFFQAVIFSLNELELAKTGFLLNWQGLDNYRYALLTHPTFNRTFTESIGETLSNLPMILGFSLFAAAVLNQQFKGRSIARMILFLPVILGAGVVLKMEVSDYAYIMAQHSDNAIMFSGPALRELLTTARLPESVLEYLIEAIASIPDIIRASGVQILIFLAGFQSISTSIFEAADVEGATPWERFWLITFPCLSPLILTNVVYTVIDSFTSMQNDLILLIDDTFFTGAGYGVSMAMTMMYFLFVAGLLGIVYAIMSRWIFYNV